MRSLSVVLVGAHGYSARRASAYPKLARIASHEGALDGCDDNLESEIALDLILDGLDGLDHA